MCAVALGLIGAVTGVRTLGSEVFNTSREVASGASLTAYFMGKMLRDLLGIVVYSLVRCALGCGFGVCCKLLLC